MLHKQASRFVNSIYKCKPMQHILKILAKVDYFPKLKAAQINTLNTHLLLHSMFNFTFRNNLIKKLTTYFNRC